MLLFEPAKIGRSLFFVLFCFFLLPLRVHGATLIDADGRNITCSRPFQRIISLYPAHTENLFSLGLDEEIIGVSRIDYPEATREKTSFHYREDAEKFIAARPDLVLVRPMISRSYPQLIGQLEKAGITVVSLQPTSATEMFDYWRDLGKLTGRQEAAEKMIYDFEKGRAEISAMVAAIPFDQRKNVYFEAIHHKMKTFAPSSLAIFALETAGGRNVAADAVRVRTSNIGYYGKEQILSKGAEIDVFLAQQGVMNRISVEAIRLEPGFMAIKAVRQGKIYLVDEPLVSRPTLRLLEGIRRIYAILYPDRVEGLNGSKLGRLPL